MGRKFTYKHVGRSVSSEGFFAPLRIVRMERYLQRAMGFVLYRKSMEDSDRLIFSKPG
jgi:hypothetical protein